MKRPKKSEYSPFHATYINCVPARGSVKSLMKRHFKELQQLLGNLPESMGDHRYAPEKWSIKEMLLHMVDTERVFAHRALWFMRGDRAPLPGFNQDHWMENIEVRHRTIKDLLKEWKTVRDNTLTLLEQCTEEQSKFTGTASNWPTTVRAYFYIILGHQLHHTQVLKERYLC